MDYTLRPYQEDALNTILGATPNFQFVLIQAATGAGKTILFCEMIKRVLKQWPYVRIAILAHRRELITQAKEKLQGVWPEAPISIACASVTKNIDTEKNIVIGSIQTLTNRLETTAPFDILICDEAHRISPKNQKSQYKIFLDTMIQYNPNIRILGFTATPFRLGHGYIYGNLCKPGNKNWFTDLHYRVGIKELQEDGHLCGYRAKGIVNLTSELKSIKVNGEYVINELSALMSQERHIGSAVNAYKKYATDRKHVVVFAVTIEHAEKLQKAFQDAGYSTGCVHSKMTLQQRDMVLKLFEKGRIRILTNVGVLTEGWDSPATDCIIMCRPTKAPALFVQMTGRGLRPSPGKKDVLILDLASNCKTHGDPDQPRVEIPRPKKKKQQEPKEEIKTCPECDEIVQKSDRECPNCGYEWPDNIVEINGEVEMKDVSFGKPEPFGVKIGEYHITNHISKANNQMIKIAMDCYVEGAMLPIKVNEFIIPNNYYGKKKWRQLVKTDPPDDIEEALERLGEVEMSMPSEIQIIEDGRWWKVHSWEAI